MQNPSCSERQTKTSASAYQAASSAWVRSSPCRTASAKAELLCEVEDRPGVGRGDRGPDQVEPRLGVEPASIEQQSLDQVVLRLVRREPADEQEDGRRPVRRPGEPRLFGLVHRAAHLLGVDDDRHDRGRPASHRLELPRVERRIRDAEHGTRRQRRGLLAGERDLVAGVLLPAVVERGRGDVVVVEDERFVRGRGGTRRSARRCSIDRAGRRLGRRALGIALEVDRLAPEVVVGRLDVDLRVPPGVAKRVPEGQGVIAGRVPSAAGPGRTDGPRSPLPDGDQHVLGGTEQQGVDRVDGRVQRGCLFAGRGDPFEAAVPAPECHLRVFEKPRSVRRCAQVSGCRGRPGARSVST